MHNTEPQADNLLAALLFTANGALKNAPFFAIIYYRWASAQLSQPCGRISMRFLFCKESIYMANIQSTFAFIFDSGKLGSSFYGEVVFEHMIKGGELSNNHEIITVSLKDCRRLSLLSRPQDPLQSVNGQIIRRQLIDMGIQIIPG